MSRWAWVRGLAVAALVTGGGCRARSGPAAGPPAAAGAEGDGGSSARALRPEPQWGEPAPELDVLARELAVHLETLRAGEPGASADPDAADDPGAPQAYYLAYDLVDAEQLWLEASHGALVRDAIDRERTVDVDVRVGSRALDNGHPAGGNYGPGNGLGSGASVALDGAPLALAHALWTDTEAQLRDALAAYGAIESEAAMRSDADVVIHPDFSDEAGEVHVERRRSFDLAALGATWRPAVLELSRALADAPEVRDATAALLVDVQTHHIVTSDGARVQTSRPIVRLMLSATAQADDGMVLQRFESFDVHDPQELPSLAEATEVAVRLRTELLALRSAPVAEPYNGPAVLEGRAAGVFFHEIFGHRLEGHRQKDDLEGQTFTDQLGKRVLPAFLDVIDDPTVARLADVPLFGHYFVDDEGVRSRRTELVERGKLRGFLLSRSPVLPFRASNGHGRRERGYPVVARQGNLIVSSRKTLPDAQLRAALREEAKRQGKPYGLWFRDIEGGYTITDRSGPQAFKVLPLMVLRVYADGRPDELVRGVDIVGTPLAAFETILATGTATGVFSGMCGAESGWVPVSAVSPALLLRNLEIERAANDRDRPPLLPPPAASLRGRGSAPGGRR